MSVTTKKIVKECKTNNKSTGLIQKKGKKGIELKAILNIWNKLKKKWYANINVSEIKIQNKYSN